MRHMLSCLSLFVIFILSCTSPKQRPNWKLEDGYVPDSKTASQVAEVLWLRIYGDKVLDNKPFKVSLRDSSVWIVEGTLKDGLVGGTPYAEIQKADGKVLKIHHTK